ncbi:MAG TPA: hypothetical protein VKE74_23970 [Gemmataceae bacterium]|nr:hypothetical protein [Gemmataceae bacterium]
MNPRVRLIVAVALFLGWIGWLAYAALSKSHGPVVSRAQATATTYAVLAEVPAGADGKPTARPRVVEVLAGDGPPADTQLFVANLPEAKGFAGAGPYLLLLTPDPSVGRVALNGQDLPAYSVVGQQRSPGYDLAGVGSPMIYPASDDVKAQAEKLLK